MAVNILYIALATLLGGFLYRWRGGGFFKSAPRPIPQALFVVFPAFLVPLKALAGAPITSIMGIMLCAMFIGAVGSCCVAHANFQDLGASAKEHPPSPLEKLIEPLKAHMSRYWYDALGLLLCGLDLTVWSGFWLALNDHPLAGLALAACGGLEAPAYMLGALIDKARPTEAGEKLTGALIWGAAAVIWRITFF